MLPLELPKAPLWTVLYPIFMLCEAEATANRDVFKLVVAQNTAKHRNLPRFQRRGRQTHCYLQAFVHFRAKSSSLRMYKYVAKTNVSARQYCENRHPNSEITKSGPPASRQDT